MKFWSKKTKIIFNENEVYGKVNRNDLNIKKGLRPIEAKARRSNRKEEKEWK